jgi:hypothetical protein
MTATLFARWCIGGLLADAADMEVRSALLRMFSAISNPAPAKQDMVS